jgi:hypothetical protein
MWWKGGEEISDVFQKDVFDELDLAFNYHFNNNTLGDQPN